MFREAHVFRGTPPTQLRGATPTGDRPWYLPTACPRGWGWGHPHPLPLHCPLCMSIELFCSSSTKHLVRVWPLCPQPRADATQCGAMLIQSQPCSGTRAEGTGPVEQKHLCL